MTRPPELPLANEVEEGGEVVAFRIRGDIVRDGAASPPRIVEAHAVDEFVVGYREHLDHSIDLISNLSNVRSFI